MDPSNASLREIFNDAAEIADPAARAAFLDSACRGDDTLRARVEQLLLADSRAGAFLQDSADPVERFPARIGDRIGRYRLRERLGRGGCGVVYLAEQEEPVRREVALKVIKLGMDTHSVVARFEVERQTLALMDHPNIARVLDAGATESGRPFFVMELVRGIPITDYCEKNGLSFRQRLELFIQICHAVQHAHQKGIIHRDLKPSNILVTTQDGVPVPKVIDFGIAKATEPGLEAHSGLTSMNQFIGTPAYMSPEQVGFGGDVDTRSDIYSLGVILYELAAGQPPFAPENLAQAGVDEMRRIIREMEPPSPSKRLAEKLRRLGSTPPPGSPPQTAQRNLHHLQHLLPQVRGDLDWIVMKCLEKDRARRYETANGLATDIRRHLDHETIAARPPTALYRFRKSVRRHRVGFAAVTAVVLTLIVAVVVSSHMAIRARQSGTLATLRLAESKASEARAAKAEAEANKRAADEITARKNSDAVSIFLLNVFGSGVTPGRDPKSVTVAERLGEAVEALHNPMYQLPQQKELAFRVGWAYTSLNLCAEGIPLLEEYRAYCLANFDADDARVMRVRRLLGYAYNQVGRFEDSAANYGELLRQERKNLGPKEIATLLTMQSLGQAYAQSKRWNEAIQVLEELREIVGKTSLDTNSGEFKSIMMFQDNLATSYLAVGRSDEAIELHKAKLKQALGSPGGGTSEILELTDRLASTCLEAGLTDEAVRYWMDASARNPNDRIYDIKVACLLVWFGKRSEHAALSGRLLKTAGDTSSAHVANCAAKIASLSPLPDPDQRQAARVLAQRAVELGGKDSLLPWFELCLGMAEFRLGNHAEAMSALQAADSGAERSSRKYRPHIQGTARCYQAMSLFLQGDKEQARKIFLPAAKAMKPLPSSERELLATGVNQDDLVLWLAYKEARTLLGESAVP